MSRVERRAVLGAYVEPLAAVLVLREFGSQLARYAEALSGSPDELNQQLAREVRTSLSRMREVSRQLQARRSPTEVGSGVGTSEPREAATGAGSLHPPRIRWVTAGEVAGQLDVSRRRATRLCETRQLPATKRGGVWFIDQADLDDYLDRRRPA